MVGRDRIELSTQGFSVQLVSVRLRPSCKLALGFGSTDSICVRADGCQSIALAVNVAVKDRSWSSPFGSHTRRSLDPGVLLTSAAAKSPVALPPLDAVSDSGIAAV
jgi:hypothetical protein